MLKKTLESPLDCKEIKPVNRKGNQSWIFIGRTDAEAEAPILWPLDAKSRLIGKDPDAGQDGRQKEKRVAEWDGWMASLTQWTRVWVNSRRQWQTGKSDVLQSMRLQGTGHDLVTEQQQSGYINIPVINIYNCTWWENIIFLLTHFIFYFALEYSWFKILC